MLTLEEMRTEVKTGAVDTLVAAFTDMEGRSPGTREHAEHFLAEVVERRLFDCFVTGRERDRLFERG